MSEIIYNESVKGVTFQVVKDTTGAIWPFKYKVVKDGGPADQAVRKCHSEDEALTALEEMMK